MKEKPCDLPFFDLLDESDKRSACITYLSRLLDMVETVHHTSVQDNKEWETMATHLYCTIDILKLEVWKDTDDDYVKESWKGDI